MRAPGPTTTCWLNGRRTPAERIQFGIDDPTVLAGRGLFETLAVHDGRALEVDEHLRRLERGAERLKLSRPESGRLREWVRRAAEELEFDRGWVKLVLGARGQCIVFGGECEPVGAEPADTAVLLPWRRSLSDPLSDLKTLNYAANLLGLAWARERGADEGIWLNSRGHLAEGCTSNLFVVQGKRIFTPGERDGILPGITRRLALRAAERLGIGVHEGKLRLVRSERAAEAFLTSSLRGVRPLVAIGGRPVGRGAPGPITRRVAAEVDRLRAAGSTRARAVDRTARAAHAASGRER